MLPSRRFRSEIWHRRLFPRSIRMHTLSVTSSAFVRKRVRSTVYSAVTQKIKELTDWKQQYTFEQGIAETIAWIRQHMDAYKTDIYNV
mgnify:CR=1 FL=1